jgi:hypothetical protein
MKKDEVKKLERLTERFSPVLLRQIDNLRIHKNKKKGYRLTINPKDPQVSRVRVGNLVDKIMRWGQNDLLVAMYDAAKQVGYEDELKAILSRVKGEIRDKEVVLQFFDIRYGQEDVDAEKEEG